MASARRAVAAEAGVSAASDFHCLREALESWWTVVEDQLPRSVSDPQVRAVLDAAVDGLFLRQLAVDRSMDHETIGAGLISVVGPIAGRRTAPARAASLRGNRT